jgi:hypothetical protein
MTTGWHQDDTTLLLASTFFLGPWLFAFFFAPSNELLYGTRPAKTTTRNSQDERMMD